MDKPTGKLTKIELEMALDQMEETLPYLIKRQSQNAKLLKAKFDTLIETGFTEQQAIEIIKSRPLIE